MVFPPQYPLGYNIEIKLLFADVNKLYLFVTGMTFFGKSEKININEVFTLIIKQLSLLT